MSDTTELVETARFLVNNATDRERVVSSLANSGYAVRVVREKAKDAYDSFQYWVAVYE